MCEIAVIDPDSTNIEIAQQLAYTFSEEQGDGLGVVAVKDDGERYSYDTYKSTEPHWQTLYSFLNREWDAAWRFVIHGRNGTSGNVNRTAAHPIEVDCDMCDWQHVIHNGSVRKWRQNRASLISHGHDFTSGVDTEVIPHKVQELPDDVNDLTYNTYNIKGNLNYILFSEDGILVRASRKYQLTDDFRMTCRYKEVKDHGFERGRNRWLIAEPGEDIQTKERKYSSTTQRKNGAKSKWGGNSRSSSSSATTSAKSTDADEEPATTTQARSGNRSRRGTDTHTVEYTDHMENYDFVSALKVAPGVLKLIEHKEEKESYVYRWQEPRLYYWYAPEPVPDSVDMERLEEIAENHTNPVDKHIRERVKEEWKTEEEPDPEQQQLDDVEKEVAAESTARAVAEFIEEGTEIKDADQAEVGEGIRQLFDEAL